MLDLPFLYHWLPYIVVLVLVITIGILVPKKSPVYMLIRKLREDLLSDAAGQPLSTLRHVLRSIAPWLFPTFYLDWTCPWPEVYQSSNQCMSITIRGSDRPLPQVLIVDNTKNKFGLSQIHLIHEGSKFVLRHDIRAKTEKLLKLYRRYVCFSRITFFSRTNLRLTGFEITETEIRLNTQPVDYEDCIRTNQSLDAHVSSRENSLRELIQRDGVLEDLRGSPLANNLGTNLLLFTSDNKLVMPRRSRRVAIRQKQLGPSASGRFYCPPNEGDTSFDRLEIAQEVFDELNLSSEDVPRERIFFMGITRELIRGGKPEAFFVAYTNLSQNQFCEKRKLARDKFESKALLFFSFDSLATEQLIDSKRDAFVVRMHLLLDEHGDEMSIDLLTNLKLWWDWRISESQPEPPLDFSMSQALY